MRTDADILRLDLRPPHVDPEGGLRLTDIEAVRLVLRGGSPIDWHRLNFSDLGEVDDLLRANLFDPEDERDMARLEYLHREALRYLKRNFTFRFPPEVERPEDVRHLLLYASEVGRMNRVQILSCVVLKTMHTINHLESRELLLETSVSEAELIAVMEKQVLARAKALSDHGLPVVHFYGSRKTRDSMVSKLLSKRAARASEILDKLRFRVVTETRDDIVPVLAYMLRHVFPWNHVTSAQSTNSLLDLRRWLEARDHTSQMVDALQVEIGLEEAEALAEVNEFSGNSYRMINFIVDVPVRLDHLLSRSGDPWMLQKGSIVYVACEFQIVDQETAWVNERGENSHARYKLRQREKVGERLMWGLLTERRRGRKKNGGSLRIARPPKTRSALEMLSDEPSDADAPVPRAVREPRPATLTMLLDENRAASMPKGPIKERGPRKGQPRQRRLDDEERVALQKLTGTMPAVAIPEDSAETLVDGSVTAAVTSFEARLEEEDSMLEPLRDT